MLISQKKTLVKEKIVKKRKKGITDDLFAHFCSNRLL